ncbi:MAG: hypothetical protein ACRD27_09585 [Terracidiphilus sp.]
MIDTQKQQYLGRAMNALQDYLIRKLLIPKIYLDTEWNGIPVQVLAIDRAGVGDVHLVWTEFLEPGVDIRAASVLSDSWLPSGVEEIKSLPSHYRYIAIVSGDPNMRQFSLRDEIIRKSFAEDGVGRVGILHVDLSEDDPLVRVILKAERFRSSKEIVELADRYVLEHTANWEIRE